MDMLFISFVFRLDNTIWVRIDEHPLLLDNYLVHLRKTHPKHKARFSEQAFVEHRDPSDKIFSRIMER